MAEFDVYYGEPNNITISLNEYKQLNRQVTELQTKGTELVESNRALKAEVEEWKEKFDSLIEAGYEECQGRQIVSLSSIIDCLRDDIKCLEAQIDELSPLGGVCADHE